MILLKHRPTGPHMAGGIIRAAGLLSSVALILLASACIHKKYDTPITKNTQQPDKVLFDQAVKDIEAGRYETARISLQTLMNTYESSEYMAKAKLAIADSWFREGGSTGLAQAESEYKDFELFYPNMEEAAEAQNRICEIHYQQMDKSDRDWTQTLRTEEECRQLIVQYPNSKFVPQATQRLRDAQENLAAHEMGVGTFYWKRDMNPAAANRLNAVADDYPLYSKTGEALYEAGDAYSKMGPRFREKAGEMFARVVREYPLSDRANDAKKRLKDLEMPIPDVDQAALEREKYDRENYHKEGVLGRSMSLMRGTPDLSHAARSGTPTMTDPKPTIPASIPVVNTASTAGAGSGTGTTDVSATTVKDSALDSKPDARSSGGTADTSAAAAANQPLPTNRDKELADLRAKQAKKQAKLDKKKKKTPDQQPATQSQPNQSSTSQPNQSSGTSGAQSLLTPSNSGTAQQTATPANQ